MNKTEWGRSQQPKYRIVELVGALTETCYSVTWLARTRFGHYTVGKHREGFEDDTPWGKWVWGYCFDDYYDEDQQECDSLEHGQRLCREHWLKTLVDDGVIEEVEE